MPQSTQPGQAKFARIWRGRVARDRADAYQRYVLAEGIAPLQARGAVAVHILRDDRADETEFVTISWWQSVEAMSGTSGSDPRRPHHLPRDAEFLIELPQTVQVLTVLDLQGRTRGPGSF